MRRLIAPAAACALCFSSSTSAADAVSETVIVTATRTARTIDENLAPVTVFTRDDILKRQATSLQDLLQGSPGVSIGNSGGEGKQTSLFLRGSNSNHVLVLVDGIKIGSATTGATALEQIPVELIERIEIVRGPRSSLYGSEAIGGVIQIFTKGGVKSGLIPRGRISAGSDRTLRTSAGFSAGTERAWVNANLTHAGTNGFNSCDGSSSMSSGCFTEERDDDAYRNTAGNLNAGLRFGNGAELDLRWLRALGSTEYDGSFENESDTVQQVLGTRLRFSPLKAWAVTLAAGQSKDESENFKDGDFTSYFDTRRDSASWQNDIAFSSKQMLTVGIDWQNDHVDSTTAYTVDDRDNLAVFSQYQASFGAHDLQLAGRRDDNEQFGSHTTGAIAWGYEFNDELRVMASYGAAFKAPTFNDLYHPMGGNPNLDPEESRSLELGLAGKYPAGHWNVNIFETRIDDLIGFDSSFNTININEARIRGLEAVLGGRLHAWSFNLSLTLLDPENRSAGPNKGNLLPRRAEESLRLDLDRDIDRFSFGTSVQLVGRRFDNVANTASLGGYALIDLRGEYVFDRHWTAQLRVANLLDKDYETVDYFNQPGRTILFTLRYEH
jgi:vitamin B12 transporter